MFAELMNQYANALGMNSSNFLNSTGLPSVNHITTARDLAILTRAIIQEFPDFYKWHSIKNFTYNNIKQKKYDNRFHITKLRAGNHNNLLHITN